MVSQYLVLPEYQDIRGARSYIGWSQTEFAVKTGLTLGSITKIETGKQKPTKETLDEIAKVFLEEGIRFHPNGGFQIEKDTIKIFEGLEGYAKIQEDIIRTCIKDNSEALFLGVNDKKSTRLTIDKEKEIYDTGVICRYLVSTDDEYILGPLEEYRKIDPSYFFSNNVVVIYSNKIVITSVSEKIVVRCVLISDDGIAEQMKQYFDNLWSKGKIITKSSAKQIFFRKNNNESIKQKI